MRVFVFAFRLVFFLTSASPLRKPPFLYSRTSYIQVPLAAGWLRKFVPKIYI